MTLAEKTDIEIGNANLETIVFLDASLVNQCIVSFVAGGSVSLVEGL